VIAKVNDGPEKSDECQEEKNDYQNGDRGRSHDPDASGRGFVVQ
jgi:hypothetical protein